MIWYIIISILIVIGLLVLAWKMNWLIEYKWLVLAMILLCGVSVYSGRWHYYYKPLAYNHLLTTAIDNESKFRDSVNTYKKDDTGLFKDFHPIAHHKLRKARNTAYSKLEKLEQEKAPANLSQRSNKIKTQKATIQALRYQIKRYKNIG